METPHLSFEISFSALDPFLDHWAPRYRYAAHEQLYEDHIGKADLKNDWKALKALFTWKNGREIAKPKLASVRANYFECWAKDADLERRYLDPRQGGGPIWNIFYLHCRFPERYPIYDQHAHRAMVYVQKRLIGRDLTKEPRLFVYESYTQRYRPFVDDISRKSGRDLRTVDRALYTFGQFLKLARPYA
jgi:hypothetical protein